MSTPARSSLLFLAPALAFSIVACQCGAPRNSAARPSPSAGAASATSAAADPAAPNAPVATVASGARDAGGAGSTGATAELPRELPPPIEAPDDVASPPADAERSRSGLVSRQLVAGTGTTHPRAWDAVQVHYTGWTRAGVMFDSSRGLPAPVEFVLDHAPPGAREALQLMVVGEKRRLWIPAALAEAGQARHPPGTLVFDIELIGITQRPQPAAGSPGRGRPANAD